MIHLILGVNPHYESDGLLLLKHILRRYSIFADQWNICYCYDRSPADHKKERKQELKEARIQLEAKWSRHVGPIIGFGWMPCEVLTNRGKTLLKNTVGTRWKYFGDSDESTTTAWVTNDPAAALFDPNIVVDIASVIKAACAEWDISTPINKSEPSFDWSKYTK